MSFADNRSELVDPWAWHAGPGGEPASVAARIDETGEDDVPAGAEDEPAAGADDEPVRGVDNEPGTADQEESATEPAVTAPANSAPAAAEAEAGVDTMAPQLDTTRLPSRFQADLMRAIFDATRDECVSVVEQTRTAGAAVVESVRQRGADEASVLGRQAEEDQEAAAEWLRLETARLNEEHERRVAQRRDDLATELEAHEALVMRQVEATQGRLSDFEERMKAYVSRLAEAPDPAALVALAQEIPVPPTPDELGAPVEPLTSVAGAVVIPGEPDVETAVPDHTWTVLDAYLGPQMQEGDDEALFLGMGELGTYGEPVERTGPDQLEHEQHAVGEVEPHPLSEQSLGAWSGVLTALLGPQMKPDDAATMFGPVSAPTQEVAEDAAWPAPDARAAPAPEARAVDSPEARAVDAESWPGAARHADSAGLEQPETVSTDPWAGASWSVTPAVPGTQSGAESERSASPGPDQGDAAWHGDPAGQVAARSGASSLSDVEPAVLTRVSVSGIASVAGVTSFRRQLSRLEGVQGVAVNARSDGSFEFDVTHHPNARLDDGITALPGFDARVTAAEGGALTVFANDPLRYP